MSKHSSQLAQELKKKLQEEFQMADMPENPVVHFPFKNKTSPSGSDNYEENFDSPPEDNVDLQMFDVQDPSKMIDTAQFDRPKYVAPENKRNVGQLVYTSSKQELRKSKDSLKNITKGTSATVEDSPRKLKNQFEHQAIHQQKYSIDKKQVQRIEKLQNKNLKGVRKEQGHLHSKDLQSFDVEDIQNINNLQNWYHDKRDSEVQDKLILSSLGPDKVAVNMDFGKMIQHYKQHNPAQQEAKFRQVTSFGQKGTKFVNAQQTLPNMPNMPRSIGPLINVHQHFNQPNIVNHNHNSYYLGKQHKEQSSAKRETKSHGNGTGQRGGRRLIKAFRQPEHQTEYNKAFLPESQIDSNRHLQLPNVAENYFNDDPSPQEPRFGGMIRTESGQKMTHFSNDEILNIEFQNSNMGREISSIDKAIKNNFNKNKNKYKSIKPNQLKILGVKKIYNQFSSNKVKGLGGSTPRNNPYSPMKQRPIDPSTIRASNFDGFQREDYQDQLFMVKSELNSAVQELTKIKTRCAILTEQNKGKDKFIDELLKSTQFVNHAMLAGTDAAAVRDLMQSYPKPIYGSDSNQSINQVIDKSPFNVLRMKKRLQDLQGLLQLKNQENHELQQNIKFTKVQALQKEINMYQRECHRLREIAYHSIQVAKMNGLDREINSHSEARDFSTNFVRMSQSSLHKKMVKDLKKNASERSLPNRKSGEKITITDQSLELKQIKESLEQAQKDRQTLIEMDKKKAERIKQLEEKLAETKEKAKMQTPKHEVAVKPVTAEKSVGTEKSKPASLQSKKHVAEMTIKEAPVAAKLPHHVQARESLFSSSLGTETQKTSNAPTQPKFLKQQSRLSDKSKDTTAGVKNSKNIPTMLSKKSVEAPKETEKKPIQQLKPPQPASVKKSISNVYEDDEEYKQSKSHVPKVDQKLTHNKNPSIGSSLLDQIKRQVSDVDEVKDPQRFEFKTNELAAFEVKASAVQMYQDELSAERKLALQAKINEEFSEVNEKYEDDYEPDEQDFEDRDDFLDEDDDIKDETINFNMTDTKQVDLKQQQEEAEKLKKIEQERKAKEEEEARKAEEMRIAAEKERKQQEELEVQRIAAEKARVEELRLKEIQEQRAKQEAKIAEEKRIAEEKAAEAEKLKREEEIKKAEELKLKQEAEALRLKQEEEAKKNKEEEEKARIAKEAEMAKLAKEAEDARIAKLTEEARAQEEKARIEKEAEEAKLAKEAEEAKLAQEAEEARLAQEAEESRLAKEAEEAKQAKEAKEADEARKAKEAEEARKAKEAEEARKAKEAEDAKKAQEAEIARLAKEAEVARLAKEAQETKLAQEQARLAEEARVAAKAKEDEKLRQTKEAEQKAALSAGKLTQAQLQNLADACRRILENKIQVDNLGANITAVHVQSLVSTAVGIFSRVGEYIMQNMDQLMESNRDIFREFIYSEVVKGPDQIKFEIEVIQPTDLIMKIDELLYPTILTQAQQTCLNIIFSCQAKKGNILFMDISTVMSTMGILDYKTPKGQDPNTTLDYESLDLKSIRLINRMIHYLGSHSLSFSEFMKDIVQIQEVKTKSANPNVEIFLAKKFFAKLHEHDIKKTPSPHPNLCLFLCIDKKYKSHLMLKKLKRCIIDFNQSNYFQSVGLKKQKLPKPEGDFEYYDEEDDTIQPNLVVQNLDQQVLNGQDQFQYYDEEDPEQSQPTVQYTSVVPALTQSQMQIQQHHLPQFGTQQSSAVAEDAAAYEYYDEEDDAGAK